MRRDTLLDFFEDFASSTDLFLIHDDGYRVRQATYAEVAAAARAFAARLDAAGIRADDKVAIWSENRIEWVVALWGCLLRRVVLVPVDFRASGDLLARIAAIVEAKAILVGVEVEPPAGLKAPLWNLSETADFGRANLGTPEPRPSADSGRLEPVEGRNPGTTTNTGATSSTLAEIIFTSGATADPKGVTITHKNLLANIIPIEREVAKYRKYERPFHPVRFLNLLPLSHMFGQSMATFVPPMLEGTVVFSHGYSPTEILHQI
jgi:long-chain acyl-CoA synthetase